MNIIKQGYEVPVIDDVCKHIEKVARTCYKSENNITETSATLLISRLKENKHYAMLEHYHFIYEVPFHIVNFIHHSKNPIFRYITITSDSFNNKHRYLASANARTLNEILVYGSEAERAYASRIANKIAEDYKCHCMFENINVPVDVDDDLIEKLVPVENDESKMTSSEFLAHGWISVKFITDRGISHEIVRHRDASFAQESTRYCNYSKDKFSNSITVIDPEIDDDNFMKNWTDAMQFAETSYFKMIDSGITPQIARSVLPNSLKTEIWMTANMREWIHFFMLRCDKAAHPQMQRLAKSLLEYFKSNYSIINNEISLTNY